jgi:hypothetical protein
MLEHVTPTQVLLPHMCFAVHPHHPRRDTFSLSRAPPSSLAWVEDALLLLDRHHLRRGPSLHLLLHTGSAQEGHQVISRTFQLQHSTVRTSHPPVMQLQA